MAEPSFDREIDPQAQVRHMVGVVRRGWLPILTCLGAGLLVGIALWFFIPKTYVSTAKFVLRSGWMFDGVGEARTMDELPFSTRARQLEDLLRSTEWIRTVLDKLEWRSWSQAKAKDDPAERVQAERLFVQKVKEKITCRVISGETGERLVFVSFAWRDRNEAAEFCDELTRHWLNTAVESYSQTVDQRVALEEELLELKREDLKEAQAALEEFERRNGISAINQRQDTQQRHDKLNLDLDAISVEIAGIDAQIEAIDHDLAATNADGTFVVPPTMPETSTINNPEKIALLDRLSVVYLTISDLEAAGFTAAWPPLKQAKEELTRLLIDASSLENIVTIETKPTPNPAWELKKADRDALYVEAQGRMAQKIKMEADVQELEATLQTLPQVLRQHESLRGDVAAAQGIYFQQMQQLQPLRDKKHALARKGPGQLLPWADLEKPVPAPSPATAIGWLALLISTMLGLGIALLVVVGKELLRSSFKNAEQARRALKLPVLGEVAPIQTAIEVRRLRFVRGLQIAASFVLLFGIGAAIWVCIRHPQDLPRGLVEWAQDLREALS